jgi:hypothetical protein
MRRERLLLEDILTATEAIAEFIQGQSAESFKANRMVRSAVVHQLTVIGEAAARLSLEFREANLTNIDVLREVGLSCQLAPENSDSACRAFGRNSVSSSKSALPAEPGHTSSQVCNLLTKIHLNKSQPQELPPPLLY